MASPAYQPTEARVMRCQILGAVFRNEKSATDAAEELAAWSGVEDENSEHGNSGCGIIETWRLVIAAAVASSTYHYALIEVLFAMSNLPPAKDLHGNPVSMEGQKVWLDLPDLSAEFMWVWRDIPSMTAKSKDEQERITLRFVNGHRFMARLTVQGVVFGKEPLNFSEWGFRTLRSALEFHFPLSTRPLTHALIEAAAVWIQCAGVQLRAQEGDEVTGVVGHWPGGGPQWPCSMADYYGIRWVYWGEKFAEAAANKALCPEVRLLAQTAAQDMEIIDTAMLNKA